MSYTVLVDIKLSRRYAGTLLEAQLVDRTGAPVGDPITTGFVEYGGGNWSLSCDPPQGFSGAILVQDRSDHSLLTTTTVAPDEIDDIRQLLDSIPAAVTQAFTDGLPVIESQISGAVVEAVGATADDIAYIRELLDQITATVTQSFSQELPEIEARIAAAIADMRAIISQAAVQQYHIPVVRRPLVPPAQVVPQRLRQSVKAMPRQLLP